MKYKVLTRMKGEKEFLAVRGNDFTNIKYFDSKESAKRYSEHLTSFETKIVSTKKGFKR